MCDPVDTPACPHQRDMGEDVTRTENTIHGEPSKVRRHGQLMKNKRCDKTETNLPLEPEQGEHFDKDDSCWKQHEKS